MPDTPTPMTPKRALTVLIALAGLLLATTLPATAHPFVRDGGEIPVDSLATITLDLAHGCGTEADGAGADTLEVALEVPQWLRIVEVAEHPGYDHDLEVEDGRVVVVTWLDDGGAEPAPTFDLDVVASGSAGETRYLAVFQGCAQQSYRWIGTPDAPADDPAIRVQLTAADPDRPAPPEGEPDAPDEAPAEAPTEEVDAGQPDEEDAEGAGVPEDADDAEDLATGTATEEAGGNPLLWGVLVVVVLLGTTVLVLRRRAAASDGRDAGASDADTVG